MRRSWLRRDRRIDGRLRYVTGFPDRPPVKTGISIGGSDRRALGVIGAMMALRHKEVNGGKGQVVMSRSARRCSR